jgi:hypothetical protein
VEREALVEARDPPVQLLALGVEQRARVLHLHLGQALAHHRPHQPRKTPCDHPQPPPLQSHPRARQLWASSRKIFSVFASVILATTTP